MIRRYQGKCLQLIIIYGIATYCLLLCVSVSSVHCPYQSIKVVVTAQDGVTTKTYTTIVTREPSADATLSALTVSTGTLAPAFTPAITAYVANVASGVTEVSVTPTTADGTALLTVNGVSVVSGRPSSALALPVGSHLTVEVVVTAANGATLRYPVVINRAPAIVNTAASALQGNPVTVVLTNQVSDGDGDEWQVLDVTNGANGTVVLNPDGSLTYTPGLSFVGIDTFTIIVVDEYGASSPLMVSIAVVAKSRSDQAADVLVHDNETGSSHVLTNDFMGENPLFTMNLQLPAGAYGGTLDSEDIFYLLYTEILTPTAEVSIPPSGFQFAGNIFTLEAFLNELNLPNFVFGEPITLTLSYDEALLGDMDESTLMLYYWDEDTQTWDQSGLTEVRRDLVANTVTYRVAHLTQFSWFAEDAPVEQLYNLWFPFVPHTTVR